MGRASTRDDPSRPRAPTAPDPSLPGREEGGRHHQLLTRSRHDSWPHDSETCDESGPGGVYLSERKRSERAQRALLRGPRRPAVLGVFFATGHPRSEHDSNAQTQGRCGGDRFSPARRLFACSESRGDGTWDKQEIPLVVFVMLFGSIFSLGTGHDGSGFAPRPTTSPAGALFLSGHCCLAREAVALYSHPTSPPPLLSSPLSFTADDGARGKDGRTRPVPGLL